MFALLDVKLIMNDTWTWWVIHDGAWVDGGEPSSDWPIQNLSWRLQNDSTLWKREKNQENEKCMKIQKVYRIINIYL